MFREVYGKAVATLVRLLGDITLAEDAVQEAFEVASRRWSLEGIPPNPAGWIVTTARNRAVDDLRRNARRNELHIDAGVLTGIDSGWESGQGEEGPITDDRLRLIFTCCHPALRTEHQVALTLRLLGRLDVAEVARSFLVTEAAMAKRLGRAKYKIRAAKIPFRLPAEADLPERLNAVLSVLYLIYNSGMNDPDGSALRTEAIRLARLLDELMPDEPEAIGLLALMLLSEARASARTVGGDAVLLRDQDRTLWNPDLIEEGQRLVQACLRRRRPGPYQLQAAIQAVHDDARTFGDTDWPQIVTLYDQLLSWLPTPVVALNRAIAIGEVQGPAAALALLAPLEDRLNGYHLFHATRATMLRRMGRITEAQAAFELALESSPTGRDRRFLQRQIEALAGSLS